MSITHHGLAGKLPDQITAIMQMADVPTDISEHLLTIYSEAAESCPRLIVELGVRGGQSTRVLVLAAELCGARVISVDIDDCSEINSSACWAFVQSDDISFGRTFADWAHTRGIEPAIDLLFIDTSHMYEHTQAEIRTWFPYLTPGAKALCHETGNSALHGFGVTRAIQDYLQIQFDESKHLAALYTGGWLIRHDPACNGLTVLRKLGV